MKTKFAFLLALSSVCLISGCTFTAQFYPVQGPLFERSPAPIFQGKMDGNLSPKTISVTLSSGETFKGNWTVPSVQERTRNAAAGTAPITNLSTAWDTVYGPGFYSAHVLGTQYFAQTVVTGSKGTVLQVEMYHQVEAGEGHDGTIGVKGVAKDSNGNIYKVVI